MNINDMSQNDFIHMS
jgi:serine/threonine protein kinase